MKSSTEPGKATSAEAEAWESEDKIVTSPTGKVTARKRESLEHMQNCQRGQKASPEPKGTIGREAHATMQSEEPGQKDAGGNK